MYMHCNRAANASARLTTKKFFKHFACMHDGYPPKKQRGALVDDNGYWVVIAKDATMTFTWVASFRLPQWTVCQWTLCSYYHGCVQ